MAHEAPLKGHLGARKTVNRLQYHLRWPGMGRDVARLIRCYHFFHLVGKPNQLVPVVLLARIPAVEQPFTKVPVDLVGPLLPTLQTTSTSSSSWM